MILAVIKNYINTVCENGKNSTNFNLESFDKRTLLKFIHVWLIHDDRQTLENNNCFIVACH